MLLVDLLTRLVTNESIQQITEDLYYGFFAVVPHDGLDWVQIDGLVGFLLEIIRTGLNGIGEFEMSWTGTNSRPETLDTPLARLGKGFLYWPWLQHTYQLKSPRNLHNALISPSILSITSSR